VSTPKEAEIRWCPPLLRRLFICSAFPAGQLQPPYPVKQIQPL